MVTVVLLAFVNVAVTGAAWVPQSGPAATHTVLGPTCAAAQLIAAGMVWKGLTKVPSAVMSLPVRVTGMQLLQSSSMAPSQSLSMPSQAGPSTAAGNPGVQIPTTPLAQAETVL